MTISFFCVNNFFTVKANIITNRLMLKNLSIKKSLIQKIYCVKMEFS